MDKKIERLIKATNALERLASGHAAKVGPLHAWWDTIFDVRQAVQEIERG